MARRDRTPISSAAPRPLWRAFATTEGAIVMGTAGLTAVVTSMPWFLALGVAGWGILAWERLGELRTQRAANRAAERFQLPQPVIERLGDEACHLAREGHRAAQAVLSEIAAAPEFARELFAVAAGEVRDLYDKYMALVGRLEEITRYLAGADVKRLDREREAMRRNAEAADDEVEREPYLDAVAWLDQSLASHGDLEKDARRIAARLAGIRAALESAAAKVVRVKSAEARAAAGEGEEVARALSVLGNEVDAMNQAVDEVFVRTRQTAVRRPLAAGQRRE